MADAPTTRPRRPPGRPKIDPTDPHPSVDVHFSASARDYDALYHLAVSDRVTVPEFIRRSLTETLRNRTDRLPDPDR